MIRWPRFRTPTKILRQLTRLSPYPISVPQFEWLQEMLKPKIYTGLNLFLQDTLDFYVVVVFFFFSNIERHQYLTTSFISLGKHHAVKS